MQNNRKKVFISYSWDGIEHQEWVLGLAEYLASHYGIDIILDQFELSAGKDLTHFMENSIAVSDKVLVILTPNYKNKAEKREDGVGYETSMISQEIFESPISVVKFIPILRTGTKKESSPKFMSSKVYIDMTDNSKYNHRAYELFRAIYDKSLVQKPQLGPIPNEDKLDYYDPVLEIASKTLDEEKLNLELDELIGSVTGIKMFTDEIVKLKSQLRAKAEFYSSNLDMLFTHEIYTNQGWIVGAGHSVLLTWSHTYSNSANNATLNISYYKGAMGKRILFDSDYPPKLLSFLDLNFDVNNDREVIWRSKNEKFTTAQIVHQAFLFIVEKMAEDRNKKFRT